MASDRARPRPKLDAVDPADAPLPPEAFRTPTPSSDRAPLPDDPSVSRYDVPEVAPPRPAPKKPVVAELRPKAPRPRAPAPPAPPPTPKPAAPAKPKTPTTGRLSDRAQRPLTVEEALAAAAARTPTPPPPPRKKAADTDPAAARVRAVLPGAEVIRVARVGDRAAFTALWTSPGDLAHRVLAHALLAAEGLRAVVVSHGADTAIVWVDGDRLLGVSSPATAFQAGLD